MIIDHRLMNHFIGSDVKYQEVVFELRQVYPHRYHSVPHMYKCA